MKLSIFSIFYIFTFGASCFAAVNIPLDPLVEPPLLLSETGVLGEGLIDYRIIQPLWVDYAAKSRRIFLPVGGKIEFSPTENYIFPVGTVFVKHFQMETAKDVFRNIETRILVRKRSEGPQKWVGYTYQWDGADAKLVDARSNPEVRLEIDETAMGGARLQLFKIPSRRQCLQCHNESLGFVRSFNTRQLNHENQLQELEQQHIFVQGPVLGQIYETFAAIEDMSAPLETRVRSYLDVNCSHCHNPGSAAMCNFTNMDFRFSHFSVDSLVATEHLVKGSKENSPIFQRMSSIQGGFRMPFIGSALRDETALSVVGSWIESLHD